MESNLKAAQEELEKQSIVNDDLEKQLKESKHRETVLLNTKDSIGPVNFQGNLLAVTTAIITKQNKWSAFHMSPN